MVSAERKGLSSCWVYHGYSPPFSIGFSTVSNTPIITNVAPRVPARLLGHAFEQQPHHRERDMCVDAVRHPVVDRAQAQAAFEFTPCLFDAL